MHSAHVNKFCVACIPSSVVLVARLTAATTPGGSVVGFNDIDSLLNSIARGVVHCTVVAVENETIQNDIGNIRRLRDDFPQHPILVWCDPKLISTRHFLDIAQLGVSEIAFQGVTDSRYVLAQLLATSRHRSFSREVYSRLSAHIPRQLRPLFEIGLARAGEPLDVNHAAAALGVTRQTLRNRLVYHGLPRTRSFLIWCRLLVGTWLLDQPGHTLESVAFQLGFSNASNLGAALRRYVGAGITELRKGPIAPTVEAEFLRIVQKGRKRAISRRQEEASSLPSS